MYCSRVGGVLSVVGSCACTGAPPATMGARSRPKPPCRRNSSAVDGQSEGRLRAASLLDTAYPTELDADLHLPELRRPKPLDRADGRLREPPPLMQEVRLRFSVRAPRRLLPGAQ